MRAHGAELIVPFACRRGQRTDRRRVRLGRKAAFARPQWGDGRKAAPKLNVVGTRCPSVAMHGDDHAKGNQRQQRENLSFLIHLFSLPLTEGVLELRSVSCVYSRHHESSVRSSRGANCAELLGI
jgi:hypothetical protein